MAISYLCQFRESPGKPQLLSLRNRCMAELWGYVPDARCIRLALYFGTQGSADENQKLH
jgi:hypothetical protein